MSTDEIVVPDVRVQRRRRWLRPSLWLAGLSLAIAAIMVWGPWTLCPSMLLGVVLILTDVLIPRSEQATLGVSAAGVRITTDRSERALSREQVRRAVILSHGAHVMLGIEPWSGPFIELLLPKAAGPLPELAARCVDRLGLGAHERVLEFGNPVAVVRAIVAWIGGAAVGSLVSLLLWNILVGALGWWGAWFDGALVVLAAMIAWGVARSSRTVDLAVGADGIELRGPWRRRYIPYAALEGVAWVPYSVLEVREATRPLLRLTNTSLVEDVSMANAFTFAVEQARARYAALRRETALTALLARDGRAAGEWQAALRALPTPGRAYRAQGFAREDLAALLVDASAPEELRVGAAVVLREMNPAEEVTRIRVAAEACAHAPMREALQRAADDTLDDAAIAALRRG
jgi:hypothetical protein